MVGSLKANKNYNPRTSPKRSEERRNVVLAKMKKNGIFDFLSLLFFKFFIKSGMYFTFKKQEKPDVSFLKLSNIYIEGNNSIRYF